MFDNNGQYVLYDEKKVTAKEPPQKCLKWLKKEICSVQVLLDFYLHEPVLVLNANLESKNNVAYLSGDDSAVGYGIWTQFSDIKCNIDITILPASKKVWTDDIKIRQEGGLDYLW